jgi:hypothetical protein
VNITNKGKRWEILHSLWILWSFTNTLACVGFFYIGGRTGTWKWIWAAFAYLVINMGSFFVIGLAPDFLGRDTFVPDLFLPVLLIGGTAGVIHSFMARKEYLIRLEAVIDLQHATRDAYRDELRSEYYRMPPQPGSPFVPVPNGSAATMTPDQVFPDIRAKDGTPVIPVRSIREARQTLSQIPPSSGCPQEQPLPRPMQTANAYPQAPVSPHATRDAYREKLRSEYFGTGQQPAPSLQPNNGRLSPQAMRPMPAPGPMPQRLDLNSATEQQLSALPGVSVALAKRAIGIRSQIGGFASVQDFCWRLGLKPQFAVQIENSTFAAPAPYPVPGMPGSPGMPGMPLPPTMAGMPGMSAAFAAPQPGQTPPTHRGQRVVDL